ncbi:MAG: hypothetical protein E7580_01445 [Ruminococcaceae bacterium]|nr:hypothetical protein [Oscillospiraceae bacterium]
MKKIFVLFLALTMILPLCACSSSLDPAATKAEEAKTEEKAPEKAPAAEDNKPDQFNISEDLPEGFAVGYAIGDITSTPISMYNATAESVHDPLQLTCIAISDGEGNVALVMTADLKGLNRDVFERSTDIIQKNFGIPAENVMISATHTHSAPTVNAGSDTNMTRFRSKYYQQLPIIVEEALRDLDEIESCYTGKGTAKSIAFVRRYLQPDGSYITHGNKSSVKHETDADPELRTIRFDRKNKKDVLMVNYQTHYGGATGMYPAQLSADFVAPFRDAAEKELDCLFAYYSGAGGNINFNSPIPGEKIYATFLDAIPEFMRATNMALDAEKEAQVGTIRSAFAWHTQAIRKDPPERVAQAKEVVDAGRETTEGKTLIGKYGFLNKYEPTSIVARNTTYGATEDVPLSAIAFGDIAFTAFPYEMFDTNGKECRDASPYDMTFVLSLAGGGYGYIPSAFAYPHGGYEVSICRFTEGCGEAFVATMLNLLNQCKAGA